MANLVSVEIVSQYVAALAEGDTERMNTLRAPDFELDFVYGDASASGQLSSEETKQYFGDTGVYISSLLSGLADVDAITISLAQLSDVGTVSMTVAAQSIVIATIANTIAKGAIVIIGGAAVLKRALLPGMLLVLVTALVVTLIFI